MTATSRTVASFPPDRPRPPPRDAARHIAEEARLVLASLRGGPPHVARGELALGLRELRALVRSGLPEGDGAGGGGGCESRDREGRCAASDEPGADDRGGRGSRPDALPDAGSVAIPSVAVAVAGTQRGGAGDAGTGEGDGCGGAADPPRIRAPPPSSPTREIAGVACGGASSLGGLPPPPLPVAAVGDANDKANDKATDANGADKDAGDAAAAEAATAPAEDRPASPAPAPAPAPPVHISPPTPHSVPPSSPQRAASATAAAGGLAAPPLPGLAPTTPLMPPPGPEEAPSTHASLPGQVQHQKHQQHNQQPQPQPHRPASMPRPLEPGAYVAPFLAVVVDPRAAGPHTLAALRALHRLLERGSVVQLSRPFPGGRGASAGAGEGPPPPPFVHETALEPVARGVLACRFEQTDAGADEAVEMAIADLLGLIVELDAAGAKAAGVELVRRAAYHRQREQQQQQQQRADQSAGNDPVHSGLKGGGVTGGPTLRVRRLPAAVLLEAFHAVLVTRHTFVRDSGGHHSPALSFHFETVLTKMVHYVFGGEDVSGSLWRGRRVGAGGAAVSGAMSSRHPAAARGILAFLVDGLGPQGPAAAAADPSGGIWGPGGADAAEDGRALCLRLIQCSLRTWEGNAPSPAAPFTEEDRALLRLIEDDLCLALLRAGQAIWAHHDEIPAAGAAPSSLGGGDPLRPSSTSLDLLSEVCASLSLLWSLPRLRARLRSQFEAIFSGFYQRALSLLRRRPLPTDGVGYQANLVFDAEVEMILESMVDVLCLSVNGEGSGNHGKPLSTAEHLFLTYDCSLTESDVASGLLVELSRCCGGVVGEDGEPYLPVPSSPPSEPQSGQGTTGAPTPRSGDSGARGAPPLLVARHRSVPDHLKELCFEALLGSLRQLFHGAESLVVRDESAGGNGGPPASLLRAAKNKKRHLHHAARLFNEKPRKGLQCLADNGMLPMNPPDPKAVASFLRNGLVVGLDKAAVGQYLGEVGKPEREGGSVWERDLFHRELLGAFCSSFKFEGLTVLDALRMFLATFRLPGEAQMIDRILQAFAESVARQCDESSDGPLGLFSTDEKRASDAAYLLSFSIIMLNTDLHNKNIRSDRKMKLEDFIRNNKNYGKEISDRDFPVEYLEGIYRAIKAEQIRTLGEGADGSMTVERWKDVMRSATSSSSNSQERTIKTATDAKDLKELLLESSWQPILSAVSGLWGMVPWEVYQADALAHSDQTGTLMGARLGIDLAYEMLKGASNLSRPDVFQDLFHAVCQMTGLLNECNKATEERAEIVLNSLEHQSALTVAMNVAEENGDTIGLDGWKAVWGMIFKLRDLQLISKRRRPNIITESDPDLLSPEARSEFYCRMANWDDEFEEADGQPSKGMSLMSFVFGSGGSSGSLNEGNNAPSQQRGQLAHGNEGQLIWDEMASSDEEEHTLNDTEYLSFPLDQSPRRISSVGSLFENRLVFESTLDNEEIGITGLERMSHSNPKSLRARVRRRLSQLVDFYGLVAESRYLSEEGLSDALNSLVEIIRDSSKRTSSKQGNEEALVSSPLSPASEAFAEILLCEIALKNRDRFAHVWNILRAHYNSRLTYRPSQEGENGGKNHKSETIKLTPGVEKCVTGLLRLCVWTSSNGKMIASQVLKLLKILHPPFGALIWSPLELNLDKHLAEGLWRICRNVDGLACMADDEGWSAIFGLAEWCATRGGLRSKDHTGSLAEDDPSLQAFR
ncbi:hypothetical protein ACHAWF_014889 [Thalassiosira exigua]